MDTLEDRLSLALRIARNMAILHDETDDNPEYYRGMEELGGYLIGCDPVGRDLISALIDMVRIAEH